MTCVLQEGPNALNLVAPDCGSFSLVSRATSQRSPINPLGRQGLPLFSVEMALFQGVQVGKIIRDFLKFRCYTYVYIYNVDVNIYI